MMSDHVVVCTEQPEVFEKDGSKVCPPIDGKTKAILKEIGVPITMKEFGEMLRPISWGLSHRGCGYHYLTNQYGELTPYRARQDNRKNEETGKWDINDVSIQIEDMGGKEGNSSVYIRLRDCTIELNEGTIYILAGDRKTGGISIHLYNFDSPLTEVEKLIETFPKDYEIRLMCTECNNQVTESKKLLAFKIKSNWTMIVMGRGFSTPKCQKCGETTFSDLNMSTEMKIFKIETNEEVESDEIFKIAEDEYYPQVRELQLKEE